GAPLLGLLGDAAWLRAVFEAVAVLPLAALALALALPRQTPRDTVSGPAQATAPAGSRPATT
ncbi:MAG: hypothetical protein ACRDPA_00335, partial [Solirubrobacteraceae bacterium]